MSQSFYQLIESSFPDDRSRIAIEVPGRSRKNSWSFDTLARDVMRYANLLAALELAHGDRVAVQVEKSPEALIIYLACLRGGFAFLPMNMAYQSSEVDYLIDDAEPALIVCDPAVLDTMQQAASKHGVKHVLTLDAHGEGTFIERMRQTRLEAKPAFSKADDLAAILYTSGTTGKPKGAMLTHGNLSSNAITLAAAWRFTDSDVLLHALPIFHTHGLFVACHCALVAGAKMIWLDKFDRVEVMRELPRATVFMGVPTFYVRLLSGDDFNGELVSHMRLFTSGSAPLLTETFEEFRSRTGVNILERYGMTETGMNTSNPYDGERRAGTVGFPLPGVEIRITNEADEVLGPEEVGGLQVRGDNVFSAYWRMPEKSAQEFAEGRWFRTGDVAKIDKDGYVHLVGRAKDLIISGGFNVYPKEIEEMIDEMPGVDESAVVGVRHKDFGEVGVAIVVLRKGATLAPDDVIARLKGSIANYKVPKRVFVVESLPRNAMGKVQKNILRETYRDACA